MFLDVEGIRVDVPDGWDVATTAVIGTEISERASTCASAEIIDEPVDGSGASLDRAAIQLCAEPVGDRRTLDEWVAARGMAATATTYGDCDVLEVSDADERRLAYVQTDTARVEVALTVTTTPELTTQRRDEVRAAIDDMHCDSPTP